jgi:hypothetical protein
VVCDLFSHLHKDLLEFEINTIQYNTILHMLILSLHFHIYSPQFKFKCNSKLYISFVFGYLGPFLVSIPQTWDYLNSGFCVLKHDTFHSTSSHQKKKKEEASWMSQCWQLDFVVMQSLFLCIINFTCNHSHSSD